MLRACRVPIWSTSVSGVSSCSSFGHNLRFVDSFFFFFLRTACLFPLGYYYYYYYYDSGLLLLLHKVWLACVLLRDGKFAAPGGVRKRSLYGPVTSGGRRQRRHTSRRRRRRNTESDSDPQVNDRVYVGISATSKYKIADIFTLHPSHEWTP